MSKALYQDESLLEIMSFIRVRNIEFVGLVNKDFAADDQSRQINAVEVNIKRPQSSEPIQVFWKPATGLIAQKAEECKQGLTSLLW